MNLFDLNSNSERCQKSLQKPLTSITSQSNAILTPTYNIPCQREIHFYVKKLIHKSGNGSFLTCIILKVQENPSKKSNKSQSQV